MATEQLENLGREDAKWLGEYSRVHMNVFGTPLRVMDHGEGAHIWDIDGNEYLDFLAGIAVNALGYAHPKWVKAVSDGFPPRLFGLPGDGKQLFKHKRNYKLP